MSSRSARRRANSARCAPLRVRALEQRVAFAWDNARVLLANARERARARLVPEGVQRIGTQPRELVAHPKDVPEILERESRRDIASLPEEHSHLAEDLHRSTVGSRLLKQGADRVAEAS